MKEEKLNNNNNYNNVNSYISTGKSQSIQLNLNGQPIKKSLSESQFKILNLFYFNYKPLTPAEIESHFEYHPETIKRTLRYFLKKGVIRLNERRLGKTRRVSNYLLTEFGEKLWEELC